MKPKVVVKDEARQVRDLMLFGLGFLGLLAGVIFASRLQPADPPSQGSLGWALAFSLAVTVTLLADFVSHLLRRRILAMLLLKLAMLVFNALLLVAEFMVFIFATASAG